jgi:hypothetical protein
MVKIARNYSRMKSAMSGGGGLASLFKKDFTLKPMFVDISEALLALQPGLEAIEPARVLMFSQLTSVVERLARITTPFERFVKAFGTFSKDIGVFTKNWKQFNAEEAKNFKLYGDVTDKISKVDNGKLKENLAALIEYEKKKLTIEKERAAIVKDIAGGSGDPSAVIQKLESLLSMITGSDAGAGGGGAGGPITTPKIQVQGNITVMGNIDKG